MDRFWGSGPGSPNYDERPGFDEEFVALEDPVMLAYEKNCSAKYLSKVDPNEVMPF